MKKLSAIIFIFIFTIFIQAQTVTKLVQPDETPKKSEANKSSNANSGGKFNLPPEKFRPIEVVKFSAPPVIDGKLDEEVWKTGAGFERFLSNCSGQ